jgi:hypothetical protein
LAYSIHSQEKRTDAGRAELVPVLARGLQEEGLCTDPRAATLEAERFLRTLALRSGLLQHLGGDRYGFPHLTFQEYLAGRHIAAQPDPDDTIDLVMAHLHEAWWREVHLLAIGHLGSDGEGTVRASALLLTILNLYRPAPLLLRSASLEAGKPRWLVTFEARWRHHNVFSRLASGLAFAVSAPRSARRLLARQFPGRQLPRRLAWVLAREFELAACGYSDCTLPDTTEAACRDLREGAAALLLRIVHDPGRQEEKGDLLAAACRVLAGQPREGVVAALVCALGDENWYVQWAAAESLVQLRQAGSSEAVAGLVHALGDENWRVRRAAAESLGRLEQAGPEAVAALVRVLGGEDWAGRQAAAESLGQLGQPGPV